MTLEDLKNKFVEKNITLGSVESFTGGLFASTITKIPGASNFFKGGLVTYATEEKERLLGIDHGLVEKHGVVSKEIAEAMAVKGQDLLNVDLCVSFTGNAGPSAMENKPVGLCYFALSDGKNCITKEKNLSGSRENIQKEAMYIALEMFEDFFNDF